MQQQQYYPGIKGTRTVLTVLRMETTCQVRLPFLSYHNMKSPANKYSKLHALWFLGNLLKDELKTKTILSSHLTPVRIVFSGSNDNRCWLGYGERGLLVTGWEDHYTGSTEVSVELPQKAGNTAIPLLAIDPKVYIASMFITEHLANRNRLDFHQLMNG